MSAQWKIGCCALTRAVRGTPAKRPWSRRKAATSRAAASPTRTDCFMPGSPIARPTKPLGLLGAIGSSSAGFMTATFFPLTSLKKYVPPSPSWQASGSTPSSSPSSILATILLATSLLPLVEPCSLNRLPLVRLTDADCEAASTGTAASMSTSPPSFVGVSVLWARESPPRTAGNVSRRTVSSSSSSSSPHLPLLAFTEKSTCRIMPSAVKPCCSETMSPACSCSVVATDMSPDAAPPARTAPTTS
mmetsp:Transcript_57726/g.182871  ORF Transcript_57726/g.182871 Transcript_57726/m.182871 type:complete len:246 (-) Transcript_57726:361-1098(-)